MAAPCYITWNSAAITTGVMAAVNTSATAGTVKTMLQLKPATPKIRIVEWGYLFSAIPGAPCQMELIETGTVFATVTTGVVSTYNDVSGAASQATLGTSATGFTATVEGTITTTRPLAQTFDVATYFKQQFPLGREPEVNGANCLRIRATPSSSVAVGVLCYIIWEE
jgi:hypothetical protein